MSESTHTPGPWRLASVDDGDELRVLVRNGFTTPIATFHRHGPGNGQGNAAFALRAANCHDDLLAACEAAQSWIADFHADARDWPDNMDALSAKLRAAIEKARTP
jgi:hypothetical protein